MFLLKLRSFFRHYGLHVVAIILLTSALLLLYFLSQAISVRHGFEQVFQHLILANLLVATVLLVTLVTLVIILIVRYRRGFFGSRILLKVAAYFAVIGVLPGVFVFGVSVQFFGRSIESWFDTSVGRSLKAGVDLGAEYMVEKKTAMMNLTEWILIAVHKQAAFPEDHLIDLMDIETITLYDHDGAVVLTWKQKPAKTLNTTDLDLLKRGEQPVFRVLTKQAPSSVSNPLVSVSLLSRLPTPERFRQHQVYAIEIKQKTQITAVELSETIQSAYQEFQLMDLGRSGLKKIYYGALTMTLLLGLFVAVLLAMVLGRALVKPLILLLQGTKDIEAGHLIALTPLKQSDEMADLVASFNKMVGQLAHARSVLEESNAYLEQILNNITGGVMVLDDAYKIVRVNKGVESVLGVSPKFLVGKYLPEIVVLRELSDLVTAQFDALLVQEDVLTEDLMHWNAQIELLNFRSGKDGELLNLNVRGARLLLSDVNAWKKANRFESVTDTKSGYVVVFDDINEILLGQRSKAWAEVAKRMAHEIKNPLTPIQLSAERLEHKLARTLPEDLRVTLKKSVQTIVNQVQAMKMIVDGFRDYAKSSPTQFSQIDLNALVTDVLMLYGVETQGLSVTQQKHKHITFVVYLQSDLPAVRGDGTQLRQVIHNLIANSVEAFPLGEKQAKVIIKTYRHQYQSSNKDIRSVVRLVVEDNAGGISAKVLARLFEPYVTTKESGTGLGLAVVKKIIDDHDALIDIRNVSTDGHAQTQGARVLLTFRKIYERES